MNWHHRPRKILITGKSGSGKTSLFLDLLIAWRARWKFIFDPEGEIARKLKIRAATSIDELHLALKGGIVAYDPGEMFCADFDEAFAFFSRWIISVAKLLKGPKVFAVDEIQNFVEAKTTLPKAFREVLNIGRRHEIDLLFISQSPNELHSKIRSQLTEIITFQHTDTLPLEWLEKDFDPEKIRTLQFPGGYLKKNLLTSAEHASDGERRTDTDAVAAR